MKKVEKEEKVEKVEKVEKETGKAPTAADEKAAAGREWGVPVAAERDIEEMGHSPDEPVLLLLRTSNCIVRPP